MASSNTEKLGTNQDVIFMDYPNKLLPSGLTGVALAFCLNQTSALAVSVIGTQDLIILKYIQ